MHKADRTIEIVNCFCRLASTFFMLSLSVPAVAQTDRTTTEVIVQYGMIDRSVKYADTHLVGLTLAKPLGKRVSLAGAVSYFTYGPVETRGWAPAELAPGKADAVSQSPLRPTRAAFLPLGLGLHFSPVTNPSVRFRPYVLGAGLVWYSRWETTAPGDDQTTKVSPGFVLGGGYGFILLAENGVGERLRLDLGAQYLFSADVGRLEVGNQSSQEIEGTRGMVWLAGLSLSP